jgi:hypothetical protein
MSTQESEEFFNAVDAGVREGVAMALRRHKQTGHPIYVWRDGKIVEIAPDQIPNADDNQGTNRR